MACQHALRLLIGGQVWWRNQDFVNSLSIHINNLEGIALPGSCSSRFRNLIQVDQHQAGHRFEIMTMGQLSQSGYGELLLQFSIRQYSIHQVTTIVSLLDGSRSRLTYNIPDQLLDHIL